MTAYPASIGVARTAPLTEADAMPARQAKTATKPSKLDILEGHIRDVRDACELFALMFGYARHTPPEHRKPGKLRSLLARMDRLELIVMNWEMDVEMLGMGASQATITRLVALEDHLAQTRKALAETRAIARELGLLPPPRKLHRP